MPTSRQMTIREFLAFALFIALGVVGLSTGGVLASIVMAAAIVGTTAAAIVAFVGRAQIRSFAIGFLIPVVAYSATVLSIGKSELDPHEGKLPTTKLIQPLFELLVRREYINLLSNEPILNYNPDINAARGGGEFGGMSGFRDMLVSTKETPDKTTFMSLAHVLLAMMFGYAGAKFGVWIDPNQHTFRTGDEPSHEPESPSPSN